MTSASVPSHRLMSAGPGITVEVSLPACILALVCCYGIQSDQRTVTWSEATLALVSPQDLFGIELTTFTAMVGAQAGKLLA